MAIHQKLPGLMQPVEKLARSINSASSTAQSTQTQAAGSIYIPNGDGTGTLIGAVNGVDDTGTPIGRIDYVGDTTPPSTPTGVSYGTGDGRIHCYWDGTLTDGVPSDFAYVEFRATYTDPEPEDEEEAAVSTQADDQPIALGRLVKASSLSFAATEGATYHCWCVAVDVQGNASDQSDTVDVVATNDITEVQTELKRTESSVEASVTALSGDVEVMQSAVKLLQDSITSLVTDQDGNSLMEQTAKGWTWSTADVMSAIAKNTSNISGVSGTVTDLQGNVSDLATNVNALLPALDYMSYSGGVLELGKTGNPFKVQITNEKIAFVQDGAEIAYLSNNQLYISAAIVTDELQLGSTDSHYVWKYRRNRHLGLRYAG